MNKWKEHVSESGRKYYFNPLTAESMWELPKGGEIIKEEDLFNPLSSRKLPPRSKTPTPGSQSKSSTIVSSSRGKDAWEGINDESDDSDTNSSSSFDMRSPMHARSMSMRSKAKGALKSAAMTISPPTAALRPRTPSKPLPITPGMLLHTASGNRLSRSMQDIDRYSESFLEDGSRGSPESTSPMQSSQYDVELSEKELKNLKKLSKKDSKEAKERVRSPSSSHSFLSMRRGSKPPLRQQSGDDYNREAKKEAADWTVIETLPLRWDPSMLGSVEPGKELIDGTCTTLGFQLELGKPNLKYGPFEIEDKSREIPYFQDTLSRLCLEHFVGEDKVLGPIVLTLECRDKTDLDQKILKGMIRSKKWDRRIAIVGQSGKSFPDSLDAKIRTIRDVVPEMGQIKWTHVKEESRLEELAAMLANFENQQIQRGYKFGVLFMKSGQKEENQFFNNVETTPEFEEFLNAIGDKVLLKGFAGFAGGLDIKSESTGTHSYHARHRGMEIMFHVSTMLPYFPKDTQQVERKRHLGNDVVMIIFKENPDDIFQPQIMASQFNHVFVVVQPEKKCRERDGVSNFFCEQVWSETLWSFTFQSSHLQRSQHPRFPADQIDQWRKGSDARSRFSSEICQDERHSLAGHC
eukprot:TRINITY_DN2615_c0_g1_i1.p1 TRINITY_DN2615_c0_g1~~TRINITY_DN2615_c0_g1_i1.p1  ORF type:complete len:634 (-),score=168.62 TRINITY_DN2615_c0_g1_i1:238-2139(-)